MNNINQEIEDLEATLVSLKAKAKAQEPTLTVVSFESRGELAKALLDGRTFKTPDGSTIIYGEETRFSSPFRLMRDGHDLCPMNGAWSQYADLHEINAEPAEPWYLNIPEEGVECYVSDVDPNPYLGRNTKGLVRRYKQGLTQPFQCGRGKWTYVWKYATPVNEGIK